MGSIEKKSIIDRKDLDEKYYFDSLLEKAYSFQMLDDSDIERIQIECLGLIAERTKRYNSGDSSSVRVETAKNIMTSNLYTISVCLKSYPNPDDSVKSLKENKIAELYSRGRKRIDILMKTAKMLRSMVLNNILETDNECYNATITDGINGFFKLYNPDFGAHEIHITSDYPVCNTVNNYTGVEFIQRYLESVYYENMFCRKFPSKNIHHLLLGYDKNYRDLFFNIYEIVLASSVGCAITGEDVRSFGLTDYSVSQLVNLFRDKPESEIFSTFLNAFEELKNILAIENNSAEQYIKSSLQKIASKVNSVIELNTFNKLFVVSDFEVKPEFQFSFGDKMDNDLYRKVVEKVRECGCLPDKMDVIRKNIRSLSDLEDILLDTGLSAGEIEGILRELSLPEVAALIKKYPFKSDMEMIDLREPERVLSDSLHEFATSLPERQQVALSKVVDMLDIAE